jgi:hypothetical protein
MKFILGLLCLLCAPLAFAGSITGTWLPSTTYEDGTPLTAPVSYRMQWGPEGQSLSKFVLTSKTTATTSADLTPGRWCIQVVSIVDGVEALPTAPFCLTVLAPKKKPSAATGVLATAAP